MKFDAKGTFETEAMIDLSQRIVAQLQDAEVTHVADVQMYMAVIDRNGESREMAINGNVVKEVPIKCDDLLALAPDNTLRFAEKTQKAQSRRPGLRKRRSA